LVDHGAHVIAVVCWIAELDLRGALRDLFEHRIINAGIDDGPRAGRTFLALETEGRLHDSGSGLVEVGIVGDDYRVLAAHLSHDPLDPKLSRLSFGGAFVDAQSDLFR